MERFPMSMEIKIINLKIIKNIINNYMDMDILENLPDDILKIILKEISQ